MVATQTLVGQSDGINKALEIEINRVMDSLRLEEMLPPSFISYSVAEAHTIHLRASLGAIVYFNKNPLRVFSGRVLVGKDGKNNENYLDEKSLFSSRGQLGGNLPFSDNPDDIRRALWLPTDKNYKNAIMSYESKMSAFRQQNIPEEEMQLPDFSPMPPSHNVLPYTMLEVNIHHLERLAKEISSVFKQYPAVQKSEVNVYVFDARLSFINSEGTTAQYPLQIASVKLVASTQAESGETLHDHVLWFSKAPNDLPDIRNMVTEAESMAKQVSSLTTVKPIEETYRGPVMFEGQAAAEVFVQKFFSEHDGLIARRKPVIANPMIASYMANVAKENDLELRLGKRIMSRDLSIEALPHMRSYLGTELLGSFTVDAEGVTPPERVVLVEDGVLLSLLNDRVPTKRVPNSNGHCRPEFGSGGVQNITAPGVVTITNSNSATKLNNDRMKQALLEEAENEGLEYAYIVRKVVSKAADVSSDDMFIRFFISSSEQTPDLSPTIEVYRVYVADGREEQVGLTEIKGLTTRSFNRLIATSEEMIVYNTMLQPVNMQLMGWNFGLKGTPASFILPHSIIFQELDVEKRKQDVISKHPVVANPLSGQ